VGEFTLTDDVQDREGKLSPNVFLCLAQLQSPLKPLFPNLRRLRVINADQSLDYLRLFLSPLLEALEIIGLSEACRPTLLSFLSAAVVEVPDLSNLILGPGRLSRDVVDACLGFGCLKHLELVDVISEVDFRLLKDIGLLKHLETFVIDAQDVVYSPSRALIPADKDAYARVVAEEIRLQKIKEEEREPRWRLDEVEERQRKAIRPRIGGICWMCERRFKKATHKTQCSSCSLEIKHQQCTREEEERQARQADIERQAIESEMERLARGAEMERAIDAEMAMITETERLAREAVEERLARESEIERQARKAEEERLAREAEEVWREIEAEMERVTREREAEELLKLEGEAIIKAESERHEKEEELWRIQETQYPEPADEEDEMEDLRDVFEMGRSIIEASLSVDSKRKDDTDDVQASIDYQGELLHPKFPKLLNIAVCGSAEMMQDAVQLITSASVVLLYLDMVLVQPPTSGIAPPPSRRFVDTVDSALRRWASTIAHVTLSGLPSVASKLPDETMEALVRLPQLEHLELNGWDFDLKIAEYFNHRLSDTGSSKLKVLHLPDDNNAISIPLSELDSIAKACPDLLSLRCRLKNLLQVETPGFPFSGSKILSHSLEILTIGDTNPPLDFDAILEVVRYIDNIFPNIKEIKPLEGMAQNAKQWRQIDKLVKLRQSGWLDRMRS